MAMQDPILFTGKELNFEIPKFTELNAAADNFRKKIQREEDMQEKLQKEFRDNMNVDLETFTSTFSMKQQAEMAKAFTDKYTKRAKENGGKLTNEDLVEMKADQTALATRQKEWLSSQALWAQDSKLVQQSPADFDKEKFAADTKNFLETGIYQPNSLEFSGINMANFFENEGWTGSTTKSEQDVVSKGGFDTYTTTVTNASEEEAKQHILQTILGDTTGRALKGVIKDFQSETDEQKYIYLKDFGGSELDKNKDQKLSDAELSNVKMTSMNILENPIIKYAEQKYLKNVMKTKVGTDIKRTPKGTGAGAEKVEPLTDAWAQQVLWSGNIKDVGFINDFLYQKRQHRVIADGTTIYAEDAPGQAVNIGNAREAKWLADYMNNIKNFQVGVDKDVVMEKNGKYDLSDMDKITIGQSVKDDETLRPLLPKGFKEKHPIEEVRVVSYNDKTKEVEFSITIKGKNATQKVKLSDLEGMPDVIKDAVFNVRISTPAGVFNINETPSADNSGATTTPKNPSGITWN